MESDLATFVTITRHPSTILCARGIDRKDAMDAFVGDLANVRSWLSAM